MADVTTRIVAIMLDVVNASSQVLQLMCLRVNVLFVFVYAQCHSAV